MRVSEILDYFAEPYLVAWKLKNKDWQKVSETSLAIGTIVDKYVQDFINVPEDGTITTAIHPIDLVNIQVSNCVNAWLKFKTERPDVFERLVKYKANMQRELVLGDLVGHPDFILDDEVIDLKTSKSIGKSHWMQTAQYMYMRSQEVDMPLNSKISILRLDKQTGEYEYKTLEEPFISFWQRKFQARLECYMEEKEFAEMMRVKLEEEKL